MIIIYPHNNKIIRYNKMGRSHFTFEDKKKMANNNKTVNHDCSYDFSLKF